MCHRTSSLLSAIHGLLCSGDPSYARPEGDADRQSHDIGRHIEWTGVAPDMRLDEFNGRTKDEGGQENSAQTLGPKEGCGKDKGGEGKGVLELVLEGQQQWNRVVRRRQREPGDECCERHSETEGNCPSPEECVAT